METKKVLQNGIEKDVYGAINMPGHEFVESCGVTFVNKANFDARNAQTLPVRSDVRFHGFVKLHSA